jgi:hypothetical protein
MEVHKHPHHPGHKKKWTEYLLEFFMLFLAVFLGFIAENVREHIVEKNRAKDLTASLITDLKKDTSELNRLYTYEAEQHKRFDSLLALLNTPFHQIPQRTFYRLVRQVQGSWDFVPANGTINQLKNAGYLRYFSKERLTTILSEYDYLINNNHVEDEIVHDLLYDKYYNIITRVLDPEIVTRQFRTEASVGEKQGIEPVEAADLKQLKNLLILMRHAREVYLSAYQDMKRKATELIVYLDE